MKLFICYYCFGVFYIFPVIVQSNVEWCLVFTDILTVCNVKYLPGFVCLLALECCYSFHLLARYISRFWPAWCAFTFFQSLYIFLDTSIFYPMCPNNFLDVFVSFKCCYCFFFLNFFKVFVYSNFFLWFW